MLRCWPSHIPNQDVGWPKVQRDRQICLEVVHSDMKQDCYNNISNIHRFTSGHLLSAAEKHSIFSVLSSGGDVGRHWWSRNCPSPGYLSLRLTVSWEKTRRSFMSWAMSSRDSMLDMRLEETWDEEVEEEEKVEDDDMETWWGGERNSLVNQCINYFT